MHDQKTLELAKILFDSYSHPVLESDYKARGVALTWENCGHAVQKLFVKRVLKMQAEFFNEEFEQQTQKLLATAKR